MADSSSSGAADVMPLTECPGGSIDRFQRWLAHGFIAGAGGDSSLLVPDGNRSIVRATLTGGGGNYSEIVVLLTNLPAGTVDLTMSRGFQITYSATADLWIELRGSVHRDGGDQWVVRLPATNGQVVSKDVTFDPTSWTTLLGTPPVTLAAVLQTATIFDIVGNAANTVTFSGLRFDNYVPTCR